MVTSPPAQHPARLRHFTGYCLLTLLRCKHLLGQFKFERSECRRPSFAINHGQAEAK